VKLRKLTFKIDPDVLHELEEFARKNKRSVSSVVSEAISEYIQTHSVRKVFRDAENEVQLENADLLQRLQD
jgi:predicted transcriptional regulator